MKILIIEDNRFLLWRLQNYLNKQFRVDASLNGLQGQRKAMSEVYDIIILDLGLPDTSGETVCTNLRQNGITTPILILTAENETNTKVRLLDIGADDYLTKPFEMDELRARIQAIARRQQSQPVTQLLRIGDLTVDPVKRHVERSGIAIPLRRKEFDILEYLVRNHGKVVTRSMIVDHVWEEGSDAWYNTVSVHIKYLRDKIDKPFETPLIKTAYGLGYTVDSQHNNQRKESA